jgi:hypothetical protein
MLSGVTISDGFVASFLEYYLIETSPSKYRMRLYTRLHDRCLPDLFLVECVPGSYLKIF